MEQISFEKLTLPNGLDVILHQDHSLPLVAVNVWYHVGSKNEEPGKTGFAHLFEHIMFEGSKHHNRSHFEPLQKVGASINGSTTPDRTNYWENLPSNYLELALWLEADRMGFLLDALDQQRFDIQRDVVKNERRQSYENRPYGMAGLRLQEAAYPMPHPYHWPTIGFHEDLDAATLEDVKAFFLRFYGPSNASLAIAGDFQMDDTVKMVERYFGDLAAGLAIPRAGRIDSPLQGHVDLTLYDRVLLPRFHQVWPTVQQFHPDAAALSILATILADGKSSRLHRALVYEGRIAQGVDVHHGAAEISGDFEMEITAALGHTAREVEAAALAEIEAIRRQPPTAEEMARAKNRFEWRHVRQMVNIGGFGGRANRLNSFNVFAGDPDMVNRDLERYLSVQPEDVSRVASAYLGDRHVRLDVLPEPSRSHSSPAIDRSVQPSPAALRPFAPPVPQRQRLSNGMELLVVEKRSIPVVAFGLIFKTGAAMDPVALPGLASFTTAMLQEGTNTRSSSDIANEFEFIGSHLAAVTGRERTELVVETMSRHWPKALEVLADLLQNPTFPEEELERLRNERVTALRRIKDDPAALAGWVTPALMYGRDSSYGHPATGTEKALESLTRVDLVGHFQKSYGPESATLIVVGDVSVEEVVKLTEEHLGGWNGNGRGGGDEGEKGDSPAIEGTTLYLMDKPGAAQSVVRVGHVGVQRQHPDYFPLSLLNLLFGGQFSGRLNMNLREDKGYSYGYHSSIQWHSRSSLLLAGGAVQTSVTREAVAETLREFKDISGGRPVSEVEFQAAKAAELLQFPSSFETPGQVLGRLAEIVSSDLPHDYYQTFTANIEAVSLSDVQRVAQEHVRSDQLVLLVVGDQSVVEPGLRELGLPLRLVDHEGREM
jgi:zinc protease